MAKNPVPDDPVIPIMATILVQPILTPPTIQAPQTFGTKALPEAQFVPQTVKQEIDFNSFRRRGDQIPDSMIVLCKLEGFPGSGKTLFYMTEAFRAKKMGIPPEQTLIYIIDFIGGTGITDILHRPAIFPSEYRQSVVHVQCPTLTIGDMAQADFMSMAMSGKYKFIVLALEGDHAIFDRARDEYALSTRGKFYSNMVQDATSMEVDAGARSKAKYMFSESVRDAYAVINPRYMTFMNTTFAIAERTGTNLYVTAHLSYKFGETFEDIRTLTALGKPDKIDGFFTKQFRLFTISENVKRDGKLEKVTRYLIDMSKCRRSRVMIVPNNGAPDIWERIEREKNGESFESVFSNSVFSDDKLKPTLTKEEFAVLGK